MSAPMVCFRVGNTDSVHKDHSRGVDVDDKGTGESARQAQVIILHVAVKPRE